MNNKIICPNCSVEISVDEALSHKYEETIRRELDKEREKERELDRKKMREWKDNLEKEQEDKERRLKVDLETGIRKQLTEETAIEQKMLKEELEQKNKQLQEQKERELKLLKQQEEIEEKTRNLELETKRRLAEERGKIQEETEKRTRDEYRLTMAEKDKVAQDLLRQIEELKQKATQGSQQLQGEIVELEIEDVLKTEFPFDDILPVPKGVNGADVLQVVRDMNGRECGIIMWESKRTKNWEDGWVMKLKADMRVAKSDIAILVSTQLPKLVHNFGPLEGIYVTNFENYLAVAKIMRIKIIEICYAKLSQEGKKDKKEILWQYLSGNEFSQRVESIVEAFGLMKESLEKEKQYFTKKWARDEKLISTIVDQTIGMHGDLQGLMGRSLPDLKLLSLESGEDN
jgi:hypothetical protein